MFPKRGSSTSLNELTQCTLLWLAQLEKLKQVDSERRELNAALNTLQRKHDSLGQSNIKCQQELATAQGLL
jgi:hypothetical protein